MTIQFQSFLEDLNMKINQWIFWLLLIFNSPFAIGQHYYYYSENITVHDGIPSNNVQVIVQDNHGFLWFGTKNGLARYDGIKFKDYPLPVDNQVFSKNLEIKSLFIDRKGNIWIGTFLHGLIKFNPKTEKFSVYLIDFTFQRDNKEAFDRITSINEDKFDNIWCGTNNGLFRLFFYGDDEVSIKRYDRYSLKEFDRLDPGNVDNSITEIYTDNKNELWVTSYLGLEKLIASNDKEGNLVSFENMNVSFAFPESFGNGISSIFEYHPGNFLICKSDNYKVYLESFNSNTQVSVRISEELEISLNESRIFQVDLKSVWISSPKGEIYHLSIPPHNLSYSEKFTLSELIPNFDISEETAEFGVFDIIKDSNGSIWLGTNNQGVIKINLNNKNVRNLSPYSDQMTSNEIVDIGVDKYNFIWFFNKFGNLYRMDQEEGKLKDYTNHPSLISKYSTQSTISFKKLSIDNSGNLWVLSNKGLFAFEENNDRFIEYYPFLRGDIFDIDSSGIIWFLDGKAIYRYNPNTQEGKGTRASSFPRLYFSHPNDILIEQQNIIFSGHNLNGINVLDEKNNLGLENYLFGYSILDLYRDSEKRIWAGTRKNGLLLIDVLSENVQITTTKTNSDGSTKITERQAGKRVPKIKASYTDKNGLPHNSIKQILEDGIGNLWLLTEKGFTIFDIKSKRFLNVPELSGLTPNTKMVKNLSGEFLFATKENIFKFNPEKIIRKKTLSNLCFTDFKLFEKPLKVGGGILKNTINHTKAIKLKHDQNSFTIEWAILNFINPSENKSYYSLEGHDPNWIETKGIHQATYSKLPPGKYSFVVKTGTQIESSNDISIKLDVVITSPFWKTGWFITIVILILLSSSWRIYRYRIKQIRKAESLKTEFNKKIAELELTALRSQMNPHFLFNCLNSIKGYMLENDAKTATDYLTKFASLIRVILNNSRSKKVKLSKEIEANRLFIEIEKLRFKNKFDYEIILSKNLKIDFVEVPPMLLQPFIENSIWHGLRHKTGREGLLIVKVEQFPQFLQFTIEDNGVGREESQKLKSRFVPKHKSLGLNITKDRIAILEKLYSISSELKIIDLKNENQKAIGTRVILKLFIPE